MNFDVSEEQQTIRELSGRVLGEACTDDRLKAFAGSRAAYDAALWSTLGQTGLLGVGVSSDAGGSGLGLLEILTLLEEQGRTLAAVPLRPTLISAMAVQAFGSSEQQAQLLPAVVRGDCILTTAFEEGGTRDPVKPKTRARRDGNGWRLDGHKVCVPYAAQADYILVPADTDEEPALFLLARETGGLTLADQVTTSGELQSELTLEDAFIPAGDILGEPADGAVDWTAQRWMAAVCAEQLGVSAEALRRTAAFLGERKQFGRPIGSFQAVQHRAADGYVDIEAMRSTFLKAAWLLSENQPATAEILAAKWWACRGGHRVAQSAQHLHGGAGADVDYPIHRFFLRAKQLELSLGAAAPTLARLGHELATGNTRPLS